MTQFANDSRTGLFLPLRYVRGRRIGCGSGVAIKDRPVLGGMGKGSGRHFDVRPHVKAALQEMLYQPCECGSGRKWKFCCWKKERAV
jgi:hypothetical protein